MKGRSARSHIALHVAPRSFSGRWAPMRCGSSSTSRKRCLRPKRWHHPSGLFIVKSVRGEPELLDVGQRELVRARDAHGPGLGVQPVREGLAHRVHAAADPLLRLQHDGIVLRAQELGRRGQAGHARADDDDPLALARHVRQAVGDDVQAVPLAWHGVGDDTGCRAGWQLRPGALSFPANTRKEDRDDDEFLAGGRLPPGLPFVHLSDAVPVQPRRDAVGHPGPVPLPLRRLGASDRAHRVRGGAAGE